MLLYDPRIPSCHQLGQLVKILFFKNVTSANLWALRSTNSLVLRFVIKYFSKKELTVLIAVMDQNLLVFLFLPNILKLWRHFTKKHWRYSKNDPMEQLLVWYCVLRVTYTNISNLNQSWIANDLTSFYMIQVSIKRNFRRDCILWSQEVLNFTCHT